MDKEIQWADNVNECRTILHKKKLYQIEIAKMALDVCEIKKGGNYKDDLFTVATFAKDIGVPKKTLQNWIELKTQVFDRLEDHFKNKVSLTQIANIKRRIGPKATKEEVNKTVEDYVNKDDFNRKIHRYVESVRALAHNFEDQDAVNRCSKGTLEEVMFYIKSIEMNVERGSKAKIKPKNNNLTNKTYANKLEASQMAPGYYNDPDGFKIKISEKDIAILHYTKRYKKHVSPTDIGIKLGKHKKSSASAWACRSLNKLESLGLVVKNKEGKYLSTVSP